MKYKTAFRVALKLLGVYFFIGGVQGAFVHLGQLLAMLSIRGFPNDQWWYYAITALGPLVQLGLGIYLFFGGKWIVDMAIPGNRPYCHECGYDLTGVVGNICNECGTPFRGPVMATPVTTTQVTSTHE